MEMIDMRAHPEGSSGAAPTSFITRLQVYVCSLIRTNAKQSTCAAQVKAQTLPEAWVAWLKNRKRRELEHKSRTANITQTPQARPRMMRIKNTARPNVGLN